MDMIEALSIDEKGLVTVNDSNSPKNSSKKWDVDKLVSQMKSIWMNRL
jgi:hypothetical protein